MMKCLCVCTCMYIGVNIYVHVSIYTVTYKVYLKSKRVLAAVAQWIECWPVNQRVAGSIPRQVTCLGCRPGPQ